MQRFARLFEELDGSTATRDKVAALVRYLGEVPAEDAAWAVYFLAGGRPRQVVPTAVLVHTARAISGLPEWLFDECYQAVGDLAETIAHVLPPARHTSGEGLAAWIGERLLPLRGLAPAEQAARLERAFSELDAAGRFLLVKLIGGGFRVGVSRLLVQRALAGHAGIDPKLVAERMMGYTDARAAPSPARYRALLEPEHPEAAAASPGQPYPFFLAHALQSGPETLEDPANWLVEWKYDGIRAQLVRRAGSVWLWSRGEELVTERYPEVAAAARALPEGTVLDGELLVWLPGSEEPAAFQKLQQRIGRKSVGKKLLAELPVVFVAYDLLEEAGIDRRGLTMAERRGRLEALIAVHGGDGLRLSPRVEAPDWPAYAALRAQARERGVEGLMFKERAARYGSGRTKSDGTWWKWKVDPLAVDAVLVYAQAGHGRRASLYTDYTFAVWNREPRDAAEADAVVQAIAARVPPPDAADTATLRLVPFAKAYSGLSDAEIAAVDRTVRANTVEKFGPVRSVKPTLVFELGFEGIGPSPRHKSGIAVRFPRMLRPRPDKPLHEADTLASLRALMGAPTT